MDLDFGRNTDWISKLPDSILCYILSFLPTKYAVGTSILSTRWQYLWTAVTSLDFDDSVIFEERSTRSDDIEDEVDLSFMNFVTRVLLLNDARCLKKFTLSLGSFCNFDVVNSWISAAIRRNLQKLVLHFSLGEEHFIENPVQLPRMVFNSKTLVELKLDGDIILKVPASVWLPSLKILNLVDLKYEGEDALQKLLSGCPVLEELFIYRWIADIQQELSIYVPTLKSLMLTRLVDEYYDQINDSDSVDESNGQHYKLVVNAPKLEHLHLNDNVAEDISLENLSSLLKAYVVVGSSFSIPVRSTDSGGRTSKLLSGIANAKFLDLFTDVKDYLLPTFHNLTHLRLGSCDGYNLDMLKDFLVHSPNLEVLVLEGNRVVLGSTKHWTPPPQVPCCLSLHLKEIEILKFNGKEYELEVIEYLLKNAEALKKMTIDWKYSDSCFSGEITGFPRGSKTCQLSLLL
ncbi:F-box/RNI-like/FBD-like domains-containing protein [Actinidia rufa]|uniref:F-box/RNI-like/FBD-like domains-containing protein n=1 Tax=Actinidia rufa TaxID=165716 RepID=A0A7J0G291_9ERIC|nr:F-box/RNI-like/FBD-like domains-containing protein [Actinidia rufa]